MLADGTTFLPDPSNSRVLGFHQPPTENGASAGLSAVELSGPESVHSDGTRLAVADVNNHRVLIWNEIPTSAQEPVDVVLGWADFVTLLPNCSAAGLEAPRDVVLVDGKLIVSEFNNNRVKIWNQVPTTSGAPADIVLGQGSFDSCMRNDDDQDGVEDASPTASVFAGPYTAAPFAGGLIVKDASNHRYPVFQAP